MLKKKSHKYGIKVPSTMSETYALDKEYENTFWRDVIMKEMKNECAPLHLIFNIKMDITIKA